MKRRTTAKVRGDEISSKPVNKPAPGDPTAPLLVNVRSAKNQLSGLLERAAQGTIVVITSDGRPKAKLIGYSAKRKRFRFDWNSLKSIPLKSGTKPVEEIVREERDSRS
jgi:prevent-host-death family protein